MEEKNKNGLLKFLALFGALFLVVFGGVKNFLRTINLVIKKKK